MRLALIVWTGLLLACAGAEERRTLNGRTLLCGDQDRRCVDYVEPHPSVDVPVREHRLRLEMKGIPDELKLPIGGADGEVAVHNWRGTLAAGYTNGLRSAFPRIPGLPIFTLELVEATPIFTAASVHVRYQVRLVDSAGNLLKKSVGTVAAKQNRAALTQIVGSAVETMYEKIAADLFSRRR